MKRLFALILLFGSLLSFTGCGSNGNITVMQQPTEYSLGVTEYSQEPTEYDPEPTECIHHWIPATFDAPGKCTLCGLIWGDKLTPASEWGFNYLYEMGYCLISITAYNLSDPNNSYVTATGESMKFENGHIFGQGFTVRNNRAEFGKYGDAYPYSIVNNDIVTIANGYKSYRIGERKTAAGRNNFVCFVMPKGAVGAFSYEEWFVPYTLIDWERGAEIVTTSEGDKGIKLYLIS